MEQIKVLDPDRRIAMGDGLRCNVNGDGQLSWSIATLCSGSEVTIYALEMVQKVCLEKFGIQVRFHHALACEKVEWKRAWILKHFSPQHLFANTADLGQSSALDLLTNAVVTIPQTDFMLAGFECDSVSMLNNGGAQFRGGCVDGGGGRTGRTA